MSVEVRWGIEGVLLHQHFSGVVTVDELKHANKLLEEATRLYPPNAAINLLINQSDPNLKLPELHEMVRVSQSFEDMRLGWVALVRSPHLMTRKLGTIAMTFIAQIAEFNLQSFATTDEALDFLAEHDPRIAACSGN